MAIWVWMDEMLFRRHAERLGFTDAQIPIISIRLIDGGVTFQEYLHHLGMPFLRRA